MTLPAACVRPQARARNTLQLSPTLAPATSSAISPATRLMSASHHLSLVVSTVIIASSVERQASSNWPTSAWALAKLDKCNGIHTVVPVDRYAVIPEATVWIASEGLPVKAKRQPWNDNPIAFQNKAPFSSANARSSSKWAFAPSYFPQWI